MDAGVEQVLHMKEGVGETSYANNSSIPRKVIMKVKPILRESVNKMLCNDVPTCLKVADLGCSSGPNALLVASNIIDIVDETSRRLKVGTPTFQFFLNDLFGNDFNSVFQSLPKFYHTLKQHTCWINATPGNILCHSLPLSFHPFLPFLLLSPMALPGSKVVERGKNVR
ncbi:probable jasmonic acid carboxyl methyltransferase 2 isoform X2 [Prosopis cineraria]|uniref:probable jasmonic acid carboxyl methyltransferase 2 isoform X2 n=1 Tax=Prosopis cineraria TaxID=364024 RepID=UPI00240FBF9A|nr:probable jasmonic acid carboxyl methyltransferase 2 isoform X2 [Prosopis cineraria]